MSRCNLSLKNREFSEIPKPKSPIPSKSQIPNSKNGVKGILVALIGCACLLSITALGCGPFFPNAMLDRGDEAVLAAPIANFFKELERLELPAAKFHAVQTTNDFFAQS